ncbi:MULTISPECIES: hypothetical protein [unclassified Carboxylicivirga]|uniref:hypothetical protein n=1 Tax=Carboxylicivirga TaxID=1628153 RepID=UPI003D32AF68
MLKKKFLELSHDSDDAKVRMKRLARLAKLQDIALFILVAMVLTWLVIVIL